MQSPEHQLQAFDHIFIRGRRLDLVHQVDEKLFDATYIGELQQRLRKAKPFPHLVLDNWFNPLLLELVREEFDLIDGGEWKVIKGDQQLTHRSKPACRLGPASEVYFGLVNSGWFVDLLARITDMEDLLPDPALLGGGLHETRAGGTFGIHRDFDLHERNGLSNRMVLITYLNPQWDPAWGAALELWSADPPACVTMIQPEFGTSVLLMHGPESFHGHPEPMHAPAGQTRRSLASYYYQNKFAVPLRMRRISSAFLFVHRARPLRHFVGRVLPPFLLDAIKKLF